MMGHHSPRRRERGLTLLELVLAVSILAVIILLNYSILRGVIQAKNVIDDKREGMYIANSVLTRLARELQMATASRQLIPARGTLSPTSNDPGTAAAPPAAPAGPRIVLLGEPGSVGQSASNGTLTFLAKEGGQYIPDGGTHSGIVQITYRVEEDPERSNQGSDQRTFLLIRDEMPVRMTPTLAYRNAIRFPITKDLVSLSFRYYDKRTNEWSDTWEGAKSVRLPNIIQFTVTLRTPAGEIESYTGSVAPRGDT